MSKTYSAGIVTAYGAAKRAGYQGTYEDFCRQQAGYAESAATVEQAKNTAVSAASTATAKAGEATTAATAAQTAKTQTEAAASQALTDIAAARSGAISAVQTEGQTQTANARAQAQAATQSATTASTKASEASVSATTATTKATEAAASATSAANAASAAQGVLNSIPEDYSDLSEDVDQLKADLDDVIDEIGLYIPPETSGTTEASSSQQTIITGTPWVNGHSYTITFTITEATNVPIYIYAKSTSETIATGTLSAGSTTVNKTFTASADDANGFVNANTGGKSVSYTIKVIDNNISQSTRIDNALSEIESVKAASNFNTIVTQHQKAVKITQPDFDPYVDVSNGTIALDDTGSWDSAVVACNEGDEFLITGIGGTGNYRLYAFVGELGSTRGNCIYVANQSESSTGYTNRAIVVPKGTKYAVFNFNKDYDKKLVHIKNLSANYILTKPRHIRFMVFGNSYGMDSITYVPFILKNLGITSDIFLYRRDACSLRDIYNRWTTDSATDTETDGIHAGTYSRTVYHIDTRMHSSWQIYSRISMKDCVELGGWDFITLQQWSAYSIDPATYSPWLALDIDLIRQSVDKATMLAWTQVCTRATYDDQQASINAFKNVPYAKYPFDFYIPYGTAIFNARANQSLAELGDYSNHNLWKDGIHLQDGLPRYIAALTVCEAICRKFFPDISVMYDKTRPTTENVTSWGNNMPMTPVVGVTEDNCLLAQYSAINACNHMFDITPTESLPSVPTT